MTRIIHTSGLRYPWKVQIVNRRGQWVGLSGRATEAEARALERRIRKVQGVV